MLDHPGKTRWLLAALKAAAPFEVELTERFIKYLRAQSDVLADKTRHVVSDLSYAGDEVVLSAVCFPSEKVEVRSLCR